MQVTEQIGMFGSTFIVTGTTESKAPEFDTKHKAIMYIDAHDTTSYLDHLKEFIQHLENEHRYNDTHCGRDVRRIVEVLRKFYGKVTGWQIKKKETLARKLEMYAITLKLDKLRIILHNAEHHSLFKVIEMQEKTELMLKNLPLN